MDFGIANNLGGYYAQNSYRASAAAGRSTNISFAETAKNVGQTTTADASGLETYRRYLQQKYGSVTVQSVAKDRETLEKVGKSMRGNDVIIAPNIFEEMAGDPKKAAYYEQKIDYFFQSIIPRETALCAAKGLVFEPCGVVVHEDGTVTYICGCSDSPKRVAEVNAINKAKRDKQAARAREIQERSIEAAMRRYEEAETNSEIVVKPDGSRVLVMTMNTGGMEMTMSLQISKPTDMVNDVARQDAGGDDIQLNDSLQRTGL